MSSTVSTRPLAERETADLELVGDVLDHRFQQRLRALRASLETIVQGSDSGMGLAIVRGVLANVVELGQSVDDLLELVRPCPARALRCSIEEVVEGAIAPLDLEDRGKVLLAVDPQRWDLFVDAPELSRSLTRLIRSGLASCSSQVLVHARSDGDTTTFAVIHDRPELERTDDLDHLLALRSAKRLGGELTFHRTADISAAFLEGLRNHASGASAA